MMNADTFHHWEKAIPRAPLVDRDAYILARCSDRDVIHLGACDTPLTFAKAEKGELLHQKLRGHCRNLIGYDIDAASVSLLKEKFGIDDIVLRDLSEPFNRPELRGNLVICADIIEHVDNVGHLLSACNRMVPMDGAILLSTINALSLKQAIRGFFAREPVDPDHVAYYSFATLGVILDRFGFAMEACRYFKYPTVGMLSGMIFDMLYALAPQSADGILIEARKVRDV
jgi:hypothetical protein